MKTPTASEQRLMDTLGFQTVEDLEEFLNLPSQGCPGMQPPAENEESLAEDQWQEQVNR